MGSGSFAPEGTLQANDQVAQDAMDDMQQQTNMQTQGQQQPTHSDPQQQVIGHQKMSMQQTQPQYQQMQSHPGQVCFLCAFISRQAR